ncbi:hypothetical protein ACIBI3_25275 [Actinomadura luteofluorescens]|uniref:hypothetical protein n=1 Tax=Actinomadura luteofluorescens TaxID=46163 RepID=UPI0034867991
MAVTEKHVATLTAQLAGQKEEYKRLYAELTPEEVGYEYSALVAAAVAIAVDRRFAVNGEIAENKEVIDFVAELRSRAVQVAEIVDPTVAEQLILQNLGKGDISSFDTKSVFTTQIVVLVGLVTDEQFDEAGLTSFMQTARQVADQWIASDQ